jgi:hypothetical protein
MNPLKFFQLLPMKRMMNLAILKKAAMTTAFIVAGLPILLLLWTSWIIFTGWTFRRPYIQALLGVIFISASIWFKNGISGLDWLPITGFHEGLKIMTEVLDATLAPIGGGFFAAAILLRSQLQNVKDIQDTRRELIDRFTHYRHLSFAMRKLVSRRHCLLKEEFDEDYNRLDLGLERCRLEIRRMQKVLLNSGEQLEVPGMGDLLALELGQGRQRRRI